MLGLEVGVVVDLLGLIEHVLGEGAVVEAGGRDRADHVEVLRLDPLSELYRVPGPLDVGDLLRFGIGGHVVDRSEVEEVLDLAFELREVLVGDAELGLGEVADHRDDPVLLGASRLRTPLVSQLLESAARALTDEDIDRPFPLKQQLDQVAADESGCAGDEVAHPDLSIRA